MTIVNTHHTTMQKFTPDTASCGQFVTSTIDLLVILNQDKQGLYSCYIGAWEAPAASPGDKEYMVARDAMAGLIARSGSKMSYKHALVYFPDLGKLSYRH